MDVTKLVYFEELVDFKQTLNSKENFSYATQFATTIIKLKNQSFLVKF